MKLSRVICLSVLMAVCLAGGGAVADSGHTDGFTINPIAVTLIGPGIAFDLFAGSSNESLLTLATHLTSEGACVSNDLIWTIATNDNVELQVSVDGLTGATAERKIKASYYIGFIPDPSSMTGAQVERAIETWSGFKHDWSSKTWYLFDPVEVDEYLGETCEVIFRCEVERKGTKDVADTYEMTITLLVLG